MKSIHQTGGHGSSSKQNSGYPIICHTVILSCYYRIYSALQLSCCMLHVQCITDECCRRLGCLYMQVPCSVWMQVPSWDLRLPQSHCHVNIDVILCVQKCCGEAASHCSQFSTSSSFYLSALSVDIHYLHYHKTCLASVVFCQFWQWFYLFALNIWHFIKIWI